MLRHIHLFVVAVAISVFPLRAADTVAFALPVSGDCVVRFEVTRANAPVSEFTRRATVQLWGQSVAEIRLSYDSGGMSRINIYKKTANDALCFYDGTTHIWTIGVDGAIASDVVVAPRRPGKINVSTPLPLKGPVAMGEAMYVGCVDLSDKNSLVFYDSKLRPEEKPIWNMNPTFKDKSMDTKSPPPSK